MAKMMKDKMMKGKLNMDTSMMKAHTDGQAMGSSSMSMSMQNMEAMKGSMKPMSSMGYGESNMMMDVTSMQGTPGMGKTVGDSHGIMNASKPGADTPNVPGAFMMMIP